MIASGYFVVMATVLTATTSASSLRSNWDVRDFVEVMNTWADFQREEAAAGATPPYPGINFQEEEDEEYYHWGEDEQDDKAKLHDAYAQQGGSCTCTVDCAALVRCCPICLTPPPPVCNYGNIYKFMFYICPPRPSPNRQQCLKDTNHQPLPVCPADLHQYNYKCQSQYYGTVCYWIFRDETHLCIPNAQFFNCYN